VDNFACIQTVNCVDQATPITTFRGGVLHGGQQRALTVLPPGAAVPSVSPLHGLQMLGKEDTTHTNTRTNNTLLIKRRGRARSASTMSVRLPLPVGLTHSRCKEMVCMHLSVLQVNSILSPPTGNRYGVGTIWYHMTPVLKQNKEIHSKSGIGEDISKQTDMSSTGCEGSLFLCKEMFQAQDHLYATVQGATSCMQLPFPPSRNVCGGQNGEVVLGKRKSICKVEE